MRQAVPAQATLQCRFSFTLAGMGKSGTVALHQALGWQAAAFTAIIAGFAIVARRQSRQRIS